MGNCFHRPAKYYEHLSNEVLTHCQTVTGFSAEKIYHEHKLFFFVAENGRLKRHEMEKLLADYLPLTKGRHSRYLTTCIFSAIDTNDDGHIDFLEYLMSIRFFQTDSPIERAKFVFRIIDKDGDHLVTRKELERILKCLEKYHQSLSNDQIDQVMSDGIESAVVTIFETLDEDKSGFIGVSEFIDGWLKNELIRTLFSF